MDFKNLEALRRRALEDPENPEARLRYLQGRARVEGEGVYLETLRDVESWRASEDALQDAAIGVVTRRLKDHFEHTATQTYSCQDQSCRIASFVHKESGISLNLIPGHRYLLRKNDKKVRGKKRVSERFLEPILIGQGPVSLAQWDRITGENKKAVRNGDIPISALSWEDVQNWVALARTLRVPSAWEWTLACYGGGFKDPFWGDAPGEEYCWSAENTRGACPQYGVEIHLQDKAWNAFGLIDMLGHINEWCGPDLGNLYPQVKGGSWREALNRCVVRGRQLRFNDAGRNDDGLRVCASIPGEEE
ncbi:MAG: SUMF1/EgtB/PvdO family nonheme iron enzyme [Planctomycetota bacterium]|nr:SUMF1/EgtB/PvdO family nonheme iron enzyme [Planctomycetota bacterium]